MGGEASEEEEEEEGERRPQGHEGGGTGPSNAPRRWGGGRGASPDLPRRVNGGGSGLAATPSLEARGGGGGGGGRGLKRRRLLEGTGDAEAAQVPVARGEAAAEPRVLHGSGCRGRGTEPFTASAEEDESGGKEVYDDAAFGASPSDSDDKGVAEQGAGRARRSAAVGAQLRWREQRRLGGL
ncbi:hypothetical protein MNEG_0150 [Monoraphidium neglectum]|uniref:Uncharacterized protein n=1 Tax=Monoraphidium neglectum TaxID=145388 RepID=A0A0D2N685_9CHLO|nr:hypothetical protein MNEG_0150 [Monoraphidium neglectum]KIZ07792.1 hypothetical protein MNEG_0150 [Monoraphidium neglectum]|eukprot:XP_013906811.1 hypothetical protein MNEG_0150 [Monoraphidium neglectum]